MPRPLVLGNGSLLIGFDDRYAIRDLFWPSVGFPNHLNGHRIRMGVWVDGRFAWADADGWARTMRMASDALVGETTLRHNELGLELVCTDAVDPLQPEYVRRIVVRNLRPAQRDVRLFFTHDLRLGQTDVGDTAFYNPYLDGLVHYKGQHYFLFGGNTKAGGVKAFATGIKAFNGLEGTWRDAEDGELSNNPIAQGSVDSTFSIHAKVGPSETETAWYWMVCASSLDQLGERFAGMMTRGTSHTLSEAERYWRSWLQRSRQPGLDHLPPEVQDLFRRSLLIMATQIDEGGAILAANDTDIMATNRATYSYMWPRDGAFISTVFDRLGYRQIAQRFFGFCNRVLSRERPILFQKYGPDGSLGASWHPWLVDGQPEVPFQEDETALTISAIWKYYERHQETEVLGELWNEFIRPTADYLESYRDLVTGLPLPSYDLWEERRGIHLWTVCAVIKALEHAASTAALMGEEGCSHTYRVAADQVRAGLEEHFWCEERGAYCRRLDLTHDGMLVPDPTLDSSVLAVTLMRVFSPDHERVVRTLATVEEGLTVRSMVGGLARYQGDYYFRRSDAYPGNPWIICTLWLAQAKLRAAKTSRDLVEPLEALRWTTRHAATTGVLAEQVHPETGEPLSVSPLTWSHAEFVHTVLEYLAVQHRLASPPPSPIR